MGNTYMQGQGLAQGNQYLEYLSNMGQQQMSPGTQGSASGGNTAYG